MAQVSRDELKILLVGKTGAGKSSTGNSILGKQTFHFSGDGKSVTDTIKVSYSELDGLQIKVIDGPGVEDTNLDDLQDKARLVTNVGKALFECNGFINAVVLVLKFGDRFTKETQSAVEAVMNTIGSDMMKDFGIVVLTNGNAWYEEFEEDTNFQDWCRNRNDFYGEIFKKCGYRCVLFENTTRDQEEIKRQRNELVNIVSNIKLSNGTYSNANFKVAAAERDKYIAKLRCHLVKEEYQSKISLLTGEMMEINDSFSEAEKSRKYKDIIQKAKDLFRQTEIDDAGSGELAKLQKQLQKTITAAEQGNLESLTTLAGKLEKLRENRKGLMAWKIFASVVNFCSLGRAASLLKEAVTKFTENDQEIVITEQELKELKNKNT